MHFKMLSAIRFNLDQSIKLLSGHGLTLYHTVPRFNNPRETAFENLWEKESEKMLVTTFSPFPTKFSLISKTNFNYMYLPTSILSCLDTVSFDCSKI